MKHLKLALAICAITTFAASCASTNTTVSNGNSNSANTTSTPVAANNNATPAPATDDLAAARSTYQAVCASCHQQNGEGGAVEFDEGTLKVPSFKTGHGLNHTDAQFARQIARGGDGMPAFEKKLTPEQINGLVRFIRQEFQKGLLKDGAPNPAH